MGYEGISKSSKKADVVCGYSPILYVNEQNE